jgi:hypothetical protein
MYQKPIEVLAREIHYEPLPQEVRAVIVAATAKGNKFLGDRGATLNEASGNVSAVQESYQLPRSSPRLARLLPAFALLVERVAQNAERDRERHRA